MKLVLAAAGLFVTLVTVGIACGPKEKFCYSEGKPCEVIKQEMALAERQSDASDAADPVKMCFDTAGKPVDCPG